MSIQPYILGIDSSTSVLKIGLSLPSGKVMSAENRDRYRHAEFIFKLIDDVLKDNDVSKRQLKGIIVSIGPGSFTGLRVGLATVKALALSLGIPLSGVSSFAGIADRLYRNYGTTVVLIPSRRDEYYSGVIDSNQFDDNNIKLLSTKEIANLNKKQNILGIDFDLRKLDLSGFKIIEPEEFSLRIEDTILYGQKWLEISRNNISELEPLYIQQFPASK